MKNIVVVALLCLGAFAQQPQTSDVSGTQPLFSANAKYVQGLGPGYWPTAGSGLTLNITAGTVWCQGTVRAYAGGTLTMTNSTTNYVYLNAASNCVPAVSTSIFTSSQVPLAVVVTSGVAITSITDDRALFSAYNFGVNVNGSSVSSPNFNDSTPAAASNNLNVTWQVSGSSISAQIAAATNSTLGLIKSATCGSNNWISSITTGTGAIGCSQPAFSNLSGAVAIGQTPLTTLGDILYADATPALARLAGQITTAKKYLSQTGTGSISAVPAWAQVAFSDLSGTLACAQMPTLAGDVSNSLCAITLGNIPSGTTMAGSILATNISAPSTPASGKESLFTDSTDKRFHDKNDAGSIGTTVVADTGASNNFLTAISAAGVISKSQPSFSNLSGSATTGQLPGTGATTINGTSCTIGSSCTLTGGTSIAGQGPIFGVKYGDNSNNGTTSAISIGTSTTGNNVTTGDVMFLFCNYFLADGGSSSTSVSDTLSSTWHRAGGGSTDYYGNVAAHEQHLSAFWAAAASSGADTFTCTSTSGSASFWRASAISIAGANSSSPIDVYAGGHNSASASYNNTSITTTLPNDLVVVWQGGGAVTNTLLGGFAITPALSGDSFLGVRSFGASGTYILEIEKASATFFNSIMFAVTN